MEKFVMFLFCVLQCFMVVYLILWNNLLLCNSILYISQSFYPICFFKVYFEEGSLFIKDIFKEILFARIA